MSPLKSPLDISNPITHSIANNALTPAKHAFLIKVNAPLASPESPRHGSLTHKTVLVLVSMDSSTRETPNAHPAIQLVKAVQHNQTQIAQNATRITYFCPQESVPA